MPQLTLNQPRKKKGINFNRPTQNTQMFNSFMNEYTSFLPVKAEWQIETLKISFFSTASILSHCDHLSDLKLTEREILVALKLPRFIDKGHGYKRGCSSCGRFMSRACETTACILKVFLTRVSDKSKGRSERDLVQRWKDVTSQTRE